MKRINLLVIGFMLLLTGVMQAQEKKNGMISEYKVSMETIKNYSSISLFQDESTDYYIAIADISTGYRFNDNLITLSFEYGSTNTSALSLNEQMEQKSILLGYRKYTALNDKIDFFVGASIGVARLDNTFDYNEEHYSFERWGGHTNLSAGLEYNISKTHYCGIAFKLPVSIVVFDNEINLPAGLEKNPVKKQMGYQITLTYGINF